MKISMKVKGMHCASCALTIEKAVKGVKGVEGISVNPVDNTASIDYDPKKAGIGEIKNAVKSKGYELA